MASEDVSADRLAAAIERLVDLRISEHKAQTPRLGAMVHVVNMSDRHIPAMLIQQQERGMGEGNTWDVLTFEGSHPWKYMALSYSESHEQFTWHWPEEDV